MQSHRELTEMLKPDTPVQASSSSTGTALIVQQDEGKNWNFRFDPDQGRHDKACAAEVRKTEDSSVEHSCEEVYINQEESSGSESDSSSDSHT
ncbi:hypothetical protein R6Q57_021279 [Mikania cordata]